MCIIFSLIYIIINIHILVYIILNFKNMYLNEDIIRYIIYIYIYIYIIFIICIP